MIVVFKPQGQTPLEVVNELREKRPELQKQVVSYAGRLDPMAEGLLLILVGDENKKRRTFERLPKVYEFDVLFGIESDSYDLLGLVRSVQRVDKKRVDQRIQELCKAYAGSFTQEYPPFSAARIGGKPLYKLAREDNLPDSLPSKSVTVERLTYIRSTDTTGRKLCATVYERVGRVRGDFRQRDILTTWEQVLKGFEREVFPIITFQATVSGGTYIRSLAHAMGKKLGSGALASRILRMRIGDFTGPQEL